MAKTTVDDVAALAGVSRATLYRMYPGGKDVLFDALRNREMSEFFGRMLGHIADATTLEELLVSTVVAATGELRAYHHLSVMLATEPGETMRDLSVDGLPRTFVAASQFFAPLVDPFLPREHSLPLVDLLARLVISYFLAPSEFVDLGDPESASRFIRAHIMPAVPSLEPLPS